MAFAFGSDASVRQAVGDGIALAHAVATPRDSNRDVLGQIDQVALAHAVTLQQFVRESVRKLSGRTLVLSDMDHVLESAVEELKEAHETSRLLTSGSVTRPATCTDMIPSCKQVRLWQDLGTNARLRAAVAVRDQCAARVQKPELGPARWRISRFLRNGFFEAHPVDDMDDRDPAGPGYRCWVPMPEAVEDLLRHWSVPAGRPLEVMWEGVPHDPAWLWPVGGYLPDHHGNDPDDQEMAAIAAKPAWECDREGNRVRFAALMKRVRRYWPEGRTVDAYLADAAERLNAEHAQPPWLGGVLDSRRIKGSYISFGSSVTTAWIDPAKVVCAGSRPWGDFADHRPETCTTVVDALLTGTLDQALDAWGLTSHPIVVARIPGPAGPVYELGSNGSHRLHTARMLDLPAIWTEVRQRTLAPWIHPDDAGAETDDDAAAVVSCWRGLLARELIVGRLNDHDDFPLTAKLGLDYAAAPWLLATPDSAAAWARAYERAYPGSLARIGIPAAAYANADGWMTWAASD